MTYDVFISYSRKDYVDEHKNVIPGNVVSKVKDALTAAGITYWFDDEGIYSGDNFTEKIVSNIEISQIFVFLSTENANQSRWTCKEIASADEFGKYIIPVRVDCTPYNRKVMFRIADLSYIDYYQNPEKGINDLIASIKAYLAQIQEDANRKKAEEEKKREAERRKAEEEKRKREEEEKLRQKLQQELIESIKLSNATINNEESKLQLDRDNLLLKVEQVTDSAKRDALKQSINTGGAIHAKYQKEQTDLKKKIQEYEQLVEKLKRQIEIINTETDVKNLYTKQIESELEDAQIKIKEFQSLIEEKKEASQSQEEEHKRFVDKLSQKTEEQQNELNENQESINNRKGTSKKMHTAYLIIILLLIVSSVYWIYNIYDNGHCWRNLYWTTEAELSSTKEKIIVLKKHINELPDIVPLIITDIDIEIIKSSNNNEAEERDIPIERIYHCKPIITYYGLKEGDYSLNIKIFNRHGTLVHCPGTNQEGYSSIQIIKIKEPFISNSEALTGWHKIEIDQRNETYRIEIWYNEEKIAEKEFQVY